MIINVVVGKNSNLSNQLKDSIDNAFLLSTLNIVEELNNINFSEYDTINFIFNQFQTASKLYIIDEPVEYIDRAMVSTAIVLDFIRVNKIRVNKIIYTSSSSVYGDNSFCSESDSLNPLSLHASLKVANEKLIEIFSVKNNIEYTIARIFNMYGGNDRFSIIYKITESLKNNKELLLINNGEATRDFIHIDDVLYAYKNLLTKKGVNIINIGSGNSKSISDIIEFLRRYGLSLNTNNLSRDELKVSVCNSRKLQSVIPGIEFKSVEDFLFDKYNLEGD